MPIMDFKAFCARKRRALMVARGPSSVMAHKFLDDVDFVVTVNQVCVDLPGIIDLAVFADDFCGELCRPAFDRIKWFLCPVPLYLNATTPAPMPWHIHRVGEKVITFPNPGNPNPTPPLEKDIKAALQTGYPVFCWTVTAAIHAPVLLGYPEVFCIGMDDLEGVAHPPYDQVKREALFFTRLMDAHHGTKTRFWVPGAERLEDFVELT